MDELIAEANQYVDEANVRGEVFFVPYLDESSYEIKYLKFEPEHSEKMTFLVKI